MRLAASLYTLASVAQANWEDVVTGRMNWDRVRSENTLRARGGEPSGLTSERAARKPATREKQRAALARYEQEFVRLDYGDQLAYLGTLRRRLTALLGSDEKAAETIKKRFKGLLKPPKATVSKSKPTKSKASSGAEIGGPRLSVEQQRVAVRELLARRPGKLSQKLCVDVLRGAPVEERALQQDSSYGKCASVPKAQLKTCVRQLILSGEIVPVGGGGTLHLKKRKP